MGIFPHWDSLIAGLSIQLPLIIFPYIYEPISYYTVLGILDTYMSFISVNISNLRVPTNSVEQVAAGIKEGSEERAIL